MRQGKVSKTNRVVTHGFFPMAQGLTFPLLILRNHALFNMVAMNIAGWVHLIKMHIYMMTNLICAVYPNRPSAMIPFAET